MERENGMNLTYEEVRLLGEPAVFSGQKIDRGTVPAGLWLYELHHKGGDWTAPDQLAEEVYLNFYGSVITNIPLQLQADGLRDLGPEDFCQMQKGSITLSEFLNKYPPVEREVISLTRAKPDEIPFFYSQGEKEDRLSGCIGHLRGDFGSGSQFYTTWWPHQGDKLNGPAFKTDLQRIVNWLRQDFSPLNDLKTMSEFCSFYDGSSAIPGTPFRTHGFRIDSQRFCYMLRCFPQKGDYNFYLYCYDKEAGERGWTGPKKELRSPVRKQREPER